ncbi:hypothetical protein [Bradyrhizobium sp.]|uniref:hypothetical protein n=1 Tax=Bradyrhizobium sp. TaxID=376 RepID=UPI0026104D07|nr:hypothetical protein [Bradyrhizobium sp.]
MSEASSSRQCLQAEPRRMRELADRLREADAATAELFSDVIREACWRVLAIPSAEYRSRIERLVQSGAWTDAALALLELELPQWRLRRVAYDAGEWHCALSRQRELPDWLDQSIEACHADLSLAILRTFIGAQCVKASPATASVPSISRTENSLDVRLCCDNFA